MDLVFGLIGKIIIKDKKMNKTCIILAILVGCATTDNVEVTPTPSTLPASTNAVYISPDEDDNPQDESPTDFSELECPDDPCVEEPTDEGCPLCTQNSAVSSD